MQFATPATTLQECKDRLEHLSDEFEQNRSSLIRPSYDEAQTRSDFIDPFFVALGWDVHNLSRQWGKARQVIPEAKLHGSKDRPDYAFNHDGMTKFLVEAKKPGVDLRTPDPVYQAKMYAYNRSVPVAILTNFDRFRVFAAVAPPEYDVPEVGLLKDLDLSYKDYTKNAALLWDVFGRPNVLRDSVEEYLTSALGKGKKQQRDPRLWLFDLPGAKPVDEDILDKLSRWRGDLARILIEGGNKFSSDGELAEAVQITLDRMMVIRVAEDRGIEQEKLLQRVVTEWSDGKHPSLYRALANLFRSLEPEYNSHLFAHHFSEKLKVRRDHDSVIRNIVDELYPPRSPYRFDQIPVEVLGTVYERFLGETIEIHGGTVKVEQKPELRHSGGIYYTPRWVVSEIVDQTVRPLLLGKGLTEMGRVRVLDPACGSGSFLIGAAKALFEAHLAWYNAPPDSDAGEEGDSRLPRGKQFGKFDQIIVNKRYAKDVFMDEGDELRLTASKKRDILLQSLFGIDKDPQAVEITKMSLSLLVLEDLGAETRRSVVKFKSSLLPDLSRNILCGNSLIAPSDVPQEVLFDEERVKRINAFDWSAPKGRGFGSVLSGKDRGFDAVIGNPPYIRIQQLMDCAPDEVEAIRGGYPAAGDGNFDIYVAFTEKSLSVLRANGLMGFIMPVRWMRAHYGNGLRTQLSDGGWLRGLDDFGPDQVFRDATTYTGIHYFAKRAHRRIQYRFVRTGSDPYPFGTREVLRSHKHSSDALSDKAWYLGVSPNLRKLFDRLRHQSTTLDSACIRISQGLKTGRDGIFVLTRVRDDGAVLRGYSKELDRVVEVESELCKSLIKSGEMQRYRLGTTDKVVIFPYTVRDGVAKLIPFSQLRKSWPRVAKYLIECEAELRGREKRKFDREDEWHQFSRHQNMDLPGLAKIVVPDIMNINRFSYDSGAEVCFMGGAAGGYGCVPKQEFDAWAMLAVLNSTLSEWMLRPPGLSDWWAGGYYNGEKRFIESLPIVPHKSKINKELSKLSVAVAQATEKREAAQGHAKDSLVRQIQGLELQIDEAVFSAFDVGKAERDQIQSEVQQWRDLYCKD